METQNDLHKWLRSNRNFNDGLKILENLDSEFSKMYLLKTGESSYTKEILFKRIKELSEAIPEIKRIIKPKEVPIITVKEESGPRDYSKLPPHLRDKFSRSGQILSEVNLEKGRLALMEQSKRPPIIHRIMELYQERKSIWEQIDEFFSPKPKPQVQEKPKKTRGMAPEAEDIDRRIKRLRQNISKNRNRSDRQHEVVEWKRKLEFLIWEKNASKKKG